MRKLRFIALALFVVPAFSLIAAERLEQCHRRCPIGWNDCKRCCDAQDAQVNGAKLTTCNNKCLAAENQCIETCRTRNAQVVKECEAAICAKLRKSYPCALNQKAHDECRKQHASGCTFYVHSDGPQPSYKVCVDGWRPCWNKCGELREPIPGGCPNEAPIDCQYTCQRWDASSQSCTGPESNRCR